MFSSRNIFNKSAQGESPEQQGRCNSCGGELYTHRECRGVFLRCGSCGTKFNVADYSQYIDDEFEEEMANVPMNRL
ncbi:dual CXXC motif small (seleno)protein [Maridesulfovibrio sp.]|uniref:dual CXXC motif small (seleno)protein n=1 Tax=Maridesulfovibrio sp. TaxID=2795000 RepID=UPI0029F4F4EC|nr:dual CXXC motif small (seleno)protein [Maridesulfovibrio sp.]